MKTKHKIQSAFTLVEVLVALLILAFAMSALQVSFAQNIDSAVYLRDRTVANWVALNQLEQLRIHNRATNEVLTETITGTEEMANRQWYWTITPQGSTQESSIVPVIVAVSMGPVNSNRAEEALESPLVSITGVIDAYHAF